MLASAYQGYRFTLESNARELDAEDIWQSAKYVIGKAVAASGQRPGALAISSFGEAAVAVDSQRNALCPVMVSSDPRSDDIYNQFSSALDAAYIARVCGLPLSSTYSFTKLVYIRQHMPEIYAKTKYFLLISDFIYYKLSGIACSEYSVASRTMLFDIYNKKWDRSLMDKFEK